MPLAIALGVAIMLCVGSGGRLRQLESMRFRHPVILGVLFLLQGLVRGRFFSDGVEAWSVPIWGMVSLLLCWVALSQRTRGLTVFAVGTAANLLVVLANGYMPVTFGTTSVGALEASAGFYRAADASTMWVWLGDVLPLSILDASYYLSAGDVLLGVGLIVFILEVTTADSVAVGVASGAGRSNW